MNQKSTPGNDTGAAYPPGLPLNAYDDKKGVSLNLGGSGSNPSCQFVTICLQSVLDLLSNFLGVANVRDRETTIRCPQ